MVWAVFQYGVEGWTLKKSDRNRIEAFEMWCWRKMLSILWEEHRTNDSILTELGLEREYVKAIIINLNYMDVRWNRFSARGRVISSRPSLFIYSTSKFCILPRDALHKHGLCRGKMSVCMSWCHKLVCVETFFTVW